MSEMTGGSGLPFPSAEGAVLVPEAGRLSLRLRGAEAQPVLLEG